MYNVRHKGTMRTKTLALPILVGEYDITLDGQKVSYRLKRSSKAKLIWLDIKRQTGLTVTIPHDYNISYLAGYLKRNSTWILRNLAKYCQETTSVPAAPALPANTISYLGKNLKVMQSRNGRGTVKLKQNNLTVNFNIAGGPISSEKVEQWLKAQAASLINTKVAQFSKQMGLIYNRVVIRDQKSRWGSCSCRRNLNFNWRLIMAPEPVLDYVVIHELCHLEEMSHSQSFWKLVARHCPRWHEYRNWLDTHCIELNAQLQF